MVLGLDHGSISQNAATCPETPFWWFGEAFIPSCQWNRYSQVTPLKKPSQSAGNHFWRGYSWHCLFVRHAALPGGKGWRLTSGSANRQSVSRSSEVRRLYNHHRQRSLLQATDLDQIIFKPATNFCRKRSRQQAGYQMIGIGVSSLSEPAMQLSLRMVPSRDSRAKPCCRPHPGQIWFYCYPDRQNNALKSRTKKVNPTNSLISSLSR